MSGVHFTDGFDRPDTIALGLDAPRLVTVVVCALSAYGVMQAPLPMALRVPVALLLVSAGASLGWARYAGRPLLSWAWLALRFALSPRAGGGVVWAPSASNAPLDDVQAALPAAEQAASTADAVAPPAAPPAAPASDLPPWARWLEMDVERTPDAGPTPAVHATDERPPPSPGTVEIARDVPMVVVMDEPATGEDTLGDDAVAADPGDERPAASIVPLRLDEPPEAPPHAAVVRLPIARGATAAEQYEVTADGAPPPVFVGAPRRVTFFSLKGGTGRTTLAAELACILAARGRHQTSDGVVRPLTVALLDLDLHSATVAVRLGIPHPTLTDYLMRGGDPAHLDSCMVRHRSGARVLLGPPKPVASGPAALEPARVAEIVHQLERDGAHFVVIDVGADLGAVTTWVLSAVHDVFVVITPTASGVQDAYRSTEALRRLGLGHKLRYVVNRARGTPELAEVMGDLGGRIAAVIPDDPAVEQAENEHRSVALDGGGPAACALNDLAALLYPSLATAQRRARLGRLPWRRHVG